MRNLADAIYECRKMINYKETQDHLHVGYARIWIHLALERVLDPRKLLAPASKNHQAVLRAFLEAGLRIGVHDRATLAWKVPAIAAMADHLWRQAKEAQGAGVTPLAGLGLQPMTSNALRFPTSEV
jgi:hypothetical protein